MQSVRQTLIFPNCYERRCEGHAGWVWPMSVLKREAVSMEVIDRLLGYIAVKTPSDEDNDSVCPSSREQFELANLLAGASIQYS